jgi:hypothetical protein
MTSKKAQQPIAHHRDGDKHVVAAQLRVLICPAPEGGFVAQGLEIDYCATGQSVSQVQDRFATGFLKTIEALLKRQKSLSALFKTTTPQDVWRAYIESDEHHELRCATVVDLSNRVPAGAPFKSLAFCQSSGIEQHA